MSESPFNKVAGCRHLTLLKRLRHRGFPVKFVKLSRTPILKDTWERLLLKIFTSLCNPSKATMHDRCIDLFMKISSSVAAVARGSSKNFFFKIPLEKFRKVRHEAPLKESIVFL